MPTIEGLVPEEWVAFKKQVIDYNLSLDLYKPDLDWKKAHLQEPLDSKEVAEYHLNIGHVNQRVGAIVLMEELLANTSALLGLY